MEGYIFTEELHESRDIWVRRGSRRRDGMPVVVKGLLDAQNAKLRHRVQGEFRILQRVSQLDSVALPRAPELVQSGRDMAIVFHDAGGVSLRRLFATRAAATDEILQLAVQVANALTLLHRAEIVHCDINPANIVWNESQSQAQVIDFDIATETSFSAAEHDGWKGVQGTLPYASPEQTGRINRPVDWRTDLYSFGATLYELVAKAPPFAGDDTAALVHATLAKEPPPLTERAPHCPRMLAQIIAKLMAKEAEDRYQSAYGVAQDLRRLQAVPITEAFHLASDDRRETFALADKLYGREANLEALQAAFDRVKAGKREVVWIGGPSGIGKSQLVAHLAKHVSEQKGLFLAGKFDQLHRHRPFNALDAALASFTQHVLVEPEESVNSWRNRLQAAFGSMGQAILNVAPTLSTLVGPQPPLPQVSPQDSENRLFAALRRLISALSREQPLTLLFDDVQWADDGTLKLFEALAQQADATAGLFLIAVYRDNEIDAQHPVQKLLDKLAHAAIAQSRIAVGPLDAEAIAELLSDATQQPVQATGALAELVREKTGGNPFFVGEFVRSLHANKLFHYDAGANVWQWDLAAVRSAGITGNVAELVTSRLQHLNTEQQAILSHCAALGNEFSSELLAATSPTPTTVLTQALGAAVRLGAVEVTHQGGQNVSYRFAHDQIQQAAYQLMQPAAKAQCNLQIARGLQRYHEAEVGDDDAWTLTVAEHFDRARALLTDEQERVQVARLHRRAAFVARRAVAYSHAALALNQAIELLGTDSGWSAHKPLMWTLHLESSECAILSGDYEAAEQASLLVQRHAGSPLDAARAQRARAECFSARGLHRQALDEGLIGLRHLGLRLSAKATALTAAKQFILLQSALRGRDIASLRSLPPMTDERVSLAIAIMQSCSFPAFRINANLFAALCLVQARLCVRYGNNEHASRIFMMVGVAHATLGQYAKAAQWLSVARRSIEAFPHLQLYGSIPMAECTFLNFASQPPWEVREILHRCVGDILQQGNIVDTWACAITDVLFLVQLSPERTLAQAENYLATLPTDSEAHRVWMQCLKHNALCLLGRTEGLHTYNDGTFDERQFEAFLHTPEGQDAIGAYLCSRTPAQWLSGDWDGAVRFGEWGVKAGCLDTVGLSASVYFAIYTLLGITCRAAVRGGFNLSRSEAKLYKRTRKTLAHVVHYHDSIYGGALTLIEANVAWAKGAGEKAAFLFERATATLERGYFFNLTAAAHECAARFYLAQSLQASAAHHAAAAMAAYAAWGVLPKVARLKQEFAEILQKSVTARSDFETHKTGRTTQSLSADAVDLPAILQLTQLLSGETSQEGLVKTIVQCMVEHSGATRAIFLSYDEPDWRVELDSAPDALGTPAQVLQFVQRSAKSLVQDNPAAKGPFTQDPYIAKRKPRAILCAPVLRQGKVLALIYLENSLASHAFTSARLTLVEVLAAQAGVSLESARLYTRLEEKVALRTEELKKAHMQLVNLERASTEMQLAGGFAHEMRNALFPASVMLEAAKGATEPLTERILGEGPNLPVASGVSGATQEALEMTLRALDQTQKSVERALRVTSDILAYAQVGQVPPTDDRVPLAPLARGVRDELLTTMAQTKVEIEIDMEPELRLAAREEHLRAILQHLLRNACDAVAQSPPEGKKVRLEARQRGERVHVRVVDQGCGMNPRTLARLYEPFFSTKGAHGTGLGLGLTRKLVALYNGQVSVESKEAQGTVVELVLPAPSASPGKLVEALQRSN